MRLVFKTRDSTSSSRDCPLSSNKEWYCYAPKLCERPLSSNTTTKDKEGEPIKMNECIPQNKDGGTPRRTTVPYVRTLPRRTIRKQCGQALGWFHKTSNDEGGRRYFLVKAVRCCLTGFPLVYHCNFIGRPEDESETENEDRLFFAEFKYVGHLSKPRVLCCTLCCILGGPHIETGLQGCTFCTCHHPLGIDFLKVSPQH